MKLALACLLFTLNAVSAAEVRLTGVLYADQSGPSATGTGEVVLAVERRVLRLEYQKPLPKRFSDPSCQIAGAIWTVQVALEGDTDGKLLSASCQGQKAEIISAAVRLVGRCLDLLADQRFREAYSLFTRKYRDHEDFKKFVGEAEAMDLGLYRTHRRTQCLEVVENGTSVSVRAGLDCLIKDRSDALLDIRFEVAIPNSARLAAIASMTRH
jgi:hypothetical protein